MSDANLQNPIFTDETKAREWLETRVWPRGVVCPHCGNADATRITALKGRLTVLASISATNAASNSLARSGPCLSAPKSR